jgi:class 3 adenylate cyclase
VLWVLLTGIFIGTGLSSAQAQTPFEIGANTTIYFSDARHALVWEDTESRATLAQARAHLADFKPADSVHKINSTSQYWVVQTLVNRLGENREFIVDASRSDKGPKWLQYQHFVVYADGTSQELNGPFSENIHTNMHGTDPRMFTMDTSLSRSPVFTLRADSEVQLFSKLKSNTGAQASPFVLPIYDRSTYLELRRYSLYLEGVLAGILLPLIINIWYSLTYKRDTVSFVYALWVVTGLLQILSMSFLDGQRLFEFFGRENLPNIGVLPVGVFVMGLLTYCQTALFMQFGRSFLGTRENFPRLHLISTVSIIFEALRFLISVFLENQQANDLLWIASIALGSICYIGFPTCALIRYRQGLRSAQFAFLSSGIYAIFWVACSFERLGYSPFELWPLTGLSVFFKNAEVLQSIAICLPAIITNFSIQSRTRGIERKLRQTMQAQKEAVENQNLMLESTVQDRTQELKEQRLVFEVLSQQLAKYLPPQIHAALIAGRYDTRVSTKRKKLTVFFSDIKDFTTTSESLQPEALTEYLNEYFSEMTQIAIEHGATIDKYIGDAMMVFFGDPESHGVREDARACVEMALKMQERMKVLAHSWKAKGFENPFVIRIGINTGYCNVGNFGSDQRLSYTIIGREVNIAQRLESQAEPGGILLSYETYAHVQDMVAVEERQSIRLKGIAQDVKAFAVKSRLSGDTQDVLTLHDPNGISIDLHPNRLDANSRARLAQTLRQMATQLDGDARGA